MQITTKRADILKPKIPDNKLSFGTVFTDHMFNMDYKCSLGWFNPRVEPYGPILLSPAALVFHYAQEVFEGLKVFRTADGSINFFRVRDNIKRFNMSCKGVCIPEIDEELFFSALKELITLDKDWIPSAPGTALYVRPVAIATEAAIGVRPSTEYRFFIILCPVGAYYASGFTPIKILVATEHVRAVKGGVGDKKAGANYAGALFATEYAKNHGYAQVLWLDAIERKHIEEVGVMNIFFVIDDEIITPELSGSILPGITRDSVIYLAKKSGMKVTERKISIDEIIQMAKEKRLQEVFGTGTAAVISSVNAIGYNGVDIKIGNGEIGPVTKKFYDTLMDIQYGRVADPANWITKV